MPDETGVLARLAWLAATGAGGNGRADGGRPRARACWRWPSVRGQHDPARLDRHPRVQRARQPGAGDRIGPRTDSGRLRAARLRQRIDGHDRGGVSRLRRAGPADPLYPAPEADQPTRQLLHGSRGCPRNLYFMWLVPTTTPPRLSSRPVSARRPADVVCCAAHRVRGGRPRAVPQGTFPSLATCAKTSADTSDPADNSASTKRLSARGAARVLPRQPYHALDWAVRWATLLYGRHLERPRCSSSARPTTRKYTVRSIRSRAP
jgi:hypothetical protein